MDPKKDVSASIAAQLDKGKGAPVPLPTPSFTMVANPKYYEDRNDKSKTNGRIAYVSLTSGVVTFEASIYLETTIEQNADGRRERKSIRFSLPKGVKMLDSIPQERLDTWKDSIVDAFLAEREKTGGSVANIRAAQAGVRQLPESAPKA